MDGVTYPGHATSPEDAGQSPPPHAASLEDALSIVSSLVWRTTLRPMQARALKFLFSVDNVDRKMLLVSRTRMIATVAAGGGIRERELAAELRRAARPPPLALRHARRAAAAAPLPAATTYYLAAEPFIICPFIFIDLTTRTIY